MAYAASILEAASQISILDDVFLAVAEIISGLEALADRLRPAGSGPIARQLRGERRDR